jgi:hypothetical protein
MILIAESGSTKSDWVAVQRQDKATFQTIGLNPYFHTSDFMENTILNNQGLYSIRQQVTNVFFYGAGCSSPKLTEVVKNALKRVFKYAEIFVGHDLEACAYATYTGEKAISCIIGTGSNSCLYDGNTVVEEVPALGYILGDEGSGSYFGKKVLADFLYKKLPLELYQDLQKAGVSHNSIKEHVYMKENANVYLASFMPIIAKHKHLPYVNQMLVNGFKHFLEIHVCCYPNYLTLPVHFIGSVAFSLIDELKQACKEKGITIGQVIKKPLDKLLEYHLNHSVTPNVHVH